MMKYSALVWMVMTSKLKPIVKDYWKEGNVNDLMKKAKGIYKNLLSEVEGVSDANPMSSNIRSGFIFLSVWLASEKKISTDDMGKIIKEFLKWKVAQNGYTKFDFRSEEGVKTFGCKMKNAASWADAHPEDNKTWKFGFNENLHKEGFYYQFSFCPIAAFCKEKGFPEFTPVLCNIDYITFKLMHANLYRQHTIANGDDICDYWIVDESVENPQ